MDALWAGLALLADVPPDPPAGSAGIDPAWKWLPVGYLLTVLIETPVLALLLSPRHPPARRLFAGLWLTACTYPAFILSLSQLFPDPESRWAYVVVGEVLVFAAECALFWAAFGTRELRGTPSMWRDMGAVVAANAASLILGEAANQAGLFDRWIS